MTDTVESKVDEFDIIVVVVLLVIFRAGSEQEHPVRSIRARAVAPRHNGVSWTKLRKRRVLRYRRPDIV